MQSLLRAFEKLANQAQDTLLVSSQHLLDRFEPSCLSCQSALERIHLFVLPQDAQSALELVDLVSKVKEVAVALDDAQLTESNLKLVYLLVFLSQACEAHHVKFSLHFNPRIPKSRALHVFINSL